MKRWTISVGLVSMLSLGFAVAAAGQEGGQGGKQGAKSAEASAVPNCPVTGEPANMAVSVATDDGPVFFCCKNCVAKYQAEPAKLAQQVAAQRKVLAGRAKVQVTCPISGQPVDKKVSIDHQGQKVYFCSQGCIGKFQSDPSKYRAALANGYTYQTICPVMGQEIDPKASATLPTGEKIYYCCIMCDKKLRDTPAKYNKNLVAQGIQINWAKVKAMGSSHGDAPGHEGHDH